MDENALVKLFKELPDRCILLLEDIDTAELGAFTAPTSTFLFQ